MQTKYPQERANQLRLKVTQQERAFSHQQEEYAHKQHVLFHEFDGALIDKDFAVQALKQEQANQKEQALFELEQARQDMERMANTQLPVCADGFSTQPYETPVEKKTLQVHSPGLSLGASANNLSQR